MYHEYKQFITDNLFWRPWGDHGIGHTRRVLNIALKLADQYSLSANDKKLLAIACCYHDIGRINDWTDDEHGFYSSQKMVKLELDQKHELSEDELELVLDLITFHSLDDDQYIADGNDLLMYQIIKDADALDRLRFDDLDTKYLRLPESKRLIDYTMSLLRADGVIKD